MATKTPYEDMLFGLKNFVINNVEDRLIEIETEKNDGIALPNFVGYGIGYRDPFSQTKYPYIMFVPDEGSPEPSANKAEEENISVDIVLVLTDTDPDRLTIQIMRYTDAIRGIVNEDGDLGGLALFAQINNMRWFSAAPGNRDLAIAVIRAEIQDEIIT